VTTRIYLQLSVNYADEPKLRALCRFGEDGLLAAYMAVGMDAYCRRNLTDGWVPAEQLPLIMWPMTAERVTTLVSYLETTEVIDVKADGYFVRDHTAKYGTREEIERRAEVHRAAGRLGGRPAGKRAGKTTRETNAETNFRAGAQAGARGGVQGGTPGEEKRREETTPPSPPAVQRAQSADPAAYGGGGGGGGDLVTQVQALMAVQHCPVDRQAAERITWTLLGSRDDIAHPAAYLKARIATAEQARELAGGTATAAQQQPPPRAHPKTDRLIADAMEDRLDGAISSGQAARIREHYTGLGITDPAEMLAAIAAERDPRTLLAPRQRATGRTVDQALGTGTRKPPATDEQREQHAANARAWLAESQHARQDQAGVPEQGAEPVLESPADDDPPF
jgi:hypothetical protein